MQAPSSFFHCFFLAFLIIIDSNIINITNKHILYNHHGFEGGWLASPPWQTLVQRQLPSAHFPDSTRITKPPPKPRRRKLKYYLWEERLTKTPCVYCVFLQLVKSSQYFSCFIVVLKPALAPQRGSREMQCMGTTQINRYTLKNHFLIKYMSEKSHAKISKT